MLRSRRDHLRKKALEVFSLKLSMHGGKGGKEVLEYETDTLRYLLSSEDGVRIGYINCITFIYKPCSLRDMLHFQRCKKWLNLNSL